MLVDFLILPGSFQINYIPVDGFHYVIRSPAAPLEYVLIRYADNVHDRGSIVPEVMKTEVGYIKLFKPAPELLRDLVRGKVYHSAFFLPQAFNDKGRHFNGTIPARGFGLFDNPAFVFIQNHRKLYCHGIPPDMGGGIP